nr:uncharacterized protein LOC128697017 [Cherax quadricarinatus]
MSLSGEEQELHCVLSWFTNWEDQQKEQFLSVLVEKAVPPDIDQLFQVKLFHDWFGTWAENERNRLLEHLRDIDPDFMSQFDKKAGGETCQEDALSPGECVEEGHNASSSASSPPSTLPRSHSPHDSGLDEPPNDSDHTEPHSIDSCHDAENVVSSNFLLVNDAVPSAAKSVSSCTRQSAYSQQDESIRIVSGFPELVKTLSTPQDITNAPKTQQTLAHH